MNSLHTISIAEAARQMQTGALTSVALVQAYLARIEATQEKLSAYITVCTDDALDGARRADADIAAGRYRGPLHGIPIALKDVIATANVRTTCHSRLLIDNVPASDAVCVSRLRDAGAIVLGKLATHEFAFGGPSFDLPFPPARNPWALDHVPGGSSSGSGVAVAAGLCAGALGSDTSGSIRMPAGNCGVVGLKPTYGRISRRGLYPLSFSMDHIGPMTWTVKDAAIMLQALAGHDPHDPGSADQPVPDFCGQFSESLAGLTVGIAHRWYEDSATADMTAAMVEALAVLRDLGANVVEVNPPDLADMNMCGRIILLSEGYAVHKAGLSSRPHDYGRFTRDRMRLGGFIGADQYIQAQRFRRILTDRMMSTMRECDVLLVANQYGPAERFSEATETFPFFDRPYLTIPFNITGQPAMTVRCGYGRNGLPLGLQIAGRPFEESVIFRVGHAYEKARCGLDERPPI